MLIFGCLAIVIKKKKRFKDPYSHITFNPPQWNHNPMAFERKYSTYPESIPSFSDWTSRAFVFSPHLIRISVVLFSAITSLNRSWRFCCQCPFVLLPKQAITNGPEVA